MYSGTLLANHNAAGLHLHMHPLLEAQNREVVTNCCMHLTQSRPLGLRTLCIRSCRILFLEHRASLLGLQAMLACIAHWDICGLARQTKLCTPTFSGKLRFILHCISFIWLGWHTRVQYISFWALALCLHLKGCCFRALNPPLLPTVLTTFVGFGT